MDLATLVTVAAVQTINRISGQRAHEILVPRQVTTLVKKHGLVQHIHRVAIVHQTRLVIAVFNLRSI